MNLQKPYDTLAKFGSV